MDRRSYTIPQRIEQLIERHGSLRATARALQLDPGYLATLRHGTKTNPSEKVLKKLGLKKIQYYILRRAG